MHLLVLQHADVEHPGIFRRFLQEDGHSWDAVELDAGEPLPDIDKYDGLWVMGGPMDVWQEDEFPWLIAEKVFIRNAVEGAGLPFLGLCLGHQLLAEALGGSVGRSEKPEVGVLPVQLTEVGASGVFLDGLPEIFPALQWHGAEVKTMPIGAECLATSPDCPVQVMRWGTRAHSCQFHIEIEPDTVNTWSKIPEYAAALSTAIGDGAVAKLDSDCSDNMREFNIMAERIYLNWLQTAAQAGP
ncbi:MAG: type 1 glutamine amidotransferase [Paracoccaceae bacterium]|jgi:GMP synthase-like glutamine amidotransferase